MPINPSIPLSLAGGGGAQQASAFDPMKNIEQLMTLKTMSQKQQLLNQQMEKEKYNTVKAATQSDIESLKLLRSRNDLVASLTTGIQSQEDLDMVRGYVQENHPYLDLSRVPQRYDAQGQKQLNLITAEALDAKEQLDYQLKLREDARAEESEARAAHKYPRDIANWYRDKWDKEDTEEAQKVFSAYRNLYSIARQKGRVADSALIFGTVKMWDPGGVVQAGDIEMAANLATVPARVKELIDKFATQGYLTAQNRAELFAIGQSRMDEEVAAYKKLKAQRAEQYIRDDPAGSPSHVFTDYLPPNVQLPEEKLKVIDEETERATPKPTGARGSRGGGGTTTRAEAQAAAAQLGITVEELVRRTGVTVE